MGKARRNQREPRARLVCLGLGPIGRAAARLALDRRDIEVVGAVDMNPELAGRDLANLCGSPSSDRVPIQAELESVLDATSPDIVLIATSSRFADVVDSIEESVRAGADVISSCEELLYPWYRHPDRTQSLDAFAESMDVTVLGTGVNPGFVLDTLVLCLSGVCREIHRVRANRVVDASTRRSQLLAKVGAGIDRSSFEDLRHRGKIGHVGLAESLALVAHAMNLGGRSGGLEITETVEPVLAEARLTLPGLVVEPGRVLGVHQVAIGADGSDEVVRFELSMFAGAPDPHDEIRIEGDPPIHARIEGGVPGDAATAGILVNMIPIVTGAAPGLATMASVPFPRWRAP